MKTRHVKQPHKNIVNIEKITSVRYYEFDKNFVFDGEKHDHWEIVYVDRGSVKICGGEKEVILKSGDIIFHEPNEFHSIKSYNSAPNFIVICFVCNSEILKYFSKYTATLNENLKPFITSIIGEAENVFGVYDYVNATGVSRNKTQKVGGEQLIRTYLEQFLIMLIRTIIDKKDSTIFPSKRQMESFTVKKARDFIESHLTEKISISDVCREIGYGKTYLSRLFHEQSGYTLINYLNYKRIESAKEMIRDGNSNLTEISDRLAFDNPQYFSRVFKRITDMTPTEFKLSVKP